VDGSERGWEDGKVGLDFNENFGKFLNESLWFWGLKRCEFQVWMLLYRFGF
jgi:hypothetical protein